jgi:hypothetical protein
MISIPYCRTLYLTINGIFIQPHPFARRRTSTIERSTGHMLCANELPRALVSSTSDQHLCNTPTSTSMSLHLQQGSTTITNQSFDPVRDGVTPPTGPPPPLVHEDHTSACANACLVASSPCLASLGRLVYRAYHPLANGQNPGMV